MTLSMIGRARTHAPMELSSRRVRLTYPSRVCRSVALRTPPSQWGMPMLAFLPWLRLREPIRVGPFHAFPQGLGDVLPDGVERGIALETVHKVLGQHRLTSSQPMRVVTVLQYDDRPIGSNLDEADRAAVFRFAEHLAVSGMADRRFIGGFLDDYTASGHYQVIIQAFSEPYRGSVALSYRRKGGHAQILMGQSDIHFVLPAHLMSQGQPAINLPLLTALQARHSLPQAICEHVDASVTQFLLANGDSPDVSLEAEHRDVCRAGAGNQLLAAPR